VWVVCARPSVSPRLVTQSCDPTSLTGSTMCGRIVSRIWLIGGPIVGVPLRRGISPHQLHAGSHAYAFTISFLTWEFQASSQPLPVLELPIFIVTIFDFSNGSHTGPLWLGPIFSVLRVRVYDALNLQLSGCLPLWLSFSCLQFCILYFSLSLI
jgi:hypothetical protein